MPGATLVYLPYKVCDVRYSEIHFKYIYNFNNRFSDCRDVVSASHGILVQQLQSIMHLHLTAQEQDLINVHMA